MPFIELRITKRASEEQAITEEMIEKILDIVASHLSICDGVRLDPTTAFDFDLTIRSLRARGEQDVTLVVEAKHSHARERDHKVMTNAIQEELQELFPDLAVAVWLKLVNAVFASST